MIAATTGARSESGQAVVAWFDSTIRLEDNTFAVTRAEPIGVYDGSITTDRFPLSHWPAGWKGVLPGVLVTLIAVGVLVVLRVVLAPMSARFAAFAQSTPPVAGVARLGVYALVMTGAVQAFHLLEHVVQVWQVYAADAEVQTGLVGARFDTEWLHLGFNATVLIGAVEGVYLARGVIVSRLPTAMPWVIAGVAAQCWHVVEHVVRVAQHTMTGVSPAPGVFGGRFGLVWFHLGINIPITIALGGLAIGWIGHSTRQKPSTNQNVRPVDSPPFAIRLESSRQA